MNWTRKSKTRRSNVQIFPVNYVFLACINDSGKENLCYTLDLLILTTIIVGASLQKKISVSQNKRRRVVQSIELTSIIAFPALRLFLSQTAYLQDRPFVCTACPECHTLAIDVVSNTYKAIVSDITNQWSKFKRWFIKITFCPN